MVAVEKESLFHVVVQAAAAVLEKQKRPAVVAGGDEVAAVVSAEDQKPWCVALQECVVVVVQVVLCLSTRLLWPHRLIVS